MSSIIWLLQNQMTRDVVAQLQRISGQQSKIQAMRNKLAIFREAAAKEDEMFAQLLVVRRIPAAYRQSLAECLRRWACPLPVTCGLTPGRSQHRLTGLGAATGPSVLRGVSVYRGEAPHAEEASVRQIEEAGFSARCRQAFAELYAGQARQMAERMGKLRQKERDKREAFRKQVQAYIPLPVLAGLGLTQQPPHCQISLPPPAPGLPSITLADLQKAPLSADPAVRLPARTPPPSGPLEPKAAATPHRGTTSPMVTSRCTSLAHQAVLPCLPGLRVHAATFRPARRAVIAHIAGRRPGCRCRGECGGGPGQRHDRGPGPRDGERAAAGRAGGAVRRGLPPRHVLRRQQ